MYEQKIVVEAWDFEKLAAHLEGMKALAKACHMGIRLIYHASRDRDELARLVTLEKYLVAWGGPYEISILFDKQAKRKALSL